MKIMIEAKSIADTTSDYKSDSEEKGVKSSELISTESTDSLQKSHLVINAGQDSTGGSEQEVTPVTVQNDKESTKNLTDEMIITVLDSVNTSERLKKQSDMCESEISSSVVVPEVKSSEIVTVQNEYSGGKVLTDELIILDDSPGTSEEPLKSSQSQNDFITVSESVSADNVQDEKPVYQIDELLDTPGTLKDSTHSQVSSSVEQELQSSVVRQNNEPVAKNLTDKMISSGTDDSPHSSECNVVRETASPDSVQNKEPDEIDKMLDTTEIVNQQSEQIETVRETVSPDSVQNKEPGEIDKMLDTTEIVNQQSEPIETVRETVSPDSVHNEEPAEIDKMLDTTENANQESEPIDTVRETVSPDSVHNKEPGETDKMLDTTENVNQQCKPIETVSICNEEPEPIVIDCSETTQLRCKSSVQEPEPDITIINEFNDLISECNQGTMETTKVKSILYKRLSTQIQDGIHNERSEDQKQLSLVDSEKAQCSNSNEITSDTNDKTLQILTSSNNLSADNVSKMNSNSDKHSSEDTGNAEDLYCIEFDNSQEQPEVISIIPKSSLEHVILDNDNTCVVTDKEKPNRIVTIDNDDNNNILASSSTSDGNEHTTEENIIVAALEPSPDVPQFASATSSKEKSSPQKNDKEKLPVTKSLFKSSYDIIELSDDEVEVLDTSKGNKCSLELQCEDDNDNSDFLNHNDNSNLLNHNDNSNLLNHNDNSNLLNHNDNSIGAVHNNMPEINPVPVSILCNSDQEAINNDSMIQLSSLFCEAFQGAQPKLTPETFLPYSEGVPSLNVLEQLSKSAYHNETLVDSTKVPAKDVIICMPPAYSKSEIINIVANCKELAIPLKRCDEKNEKDVRSMTLQKNSKLGAKATESDDHTELVLENSDNTNNVGMREKTLIDVSKTFGHKPIFGEVFSSELSFSLLSSKTGEHEKNHSSSEQVTTSPTFLQTRASKNDSIPLTRKKRKVSAENESMKKPKAKKRNFGLPKSNQNPVSLTNSRNKQNKNEFCAQNQQKNTERAISNKGKSSSEVPVVKETRKSSFADSENNSEKSRKEKETPNQLKSMNSDFVMKNNVDSNVERVVFEQPEYSNNIFDNGTVSSSEESSSEIADFEFNDVAPLETSAVETLPTVQQNVVSNIPPDNLTKVTSISSSIKPHENNQFECFLCDKFFKNRYEMKQHFILHIGKIVQVEIANSQKQNQCMFCEKPIISKQGLKFHIEKKHFVKETPKHACHFCSALFKTEDDLQEHIVIQHRSPRSNVQKTESNNCPSTSGLHDDIKISYQKIGMENNIETECSKSPVKCNKPNQLSPTQSSKTQTESQKPAAKRELGYRKSRELVSLGVKEIELFPTEPPAKIPRSSRETRTKTNSSDSSKVSVESTRKTSTSPKRCENNTSRRGRPSTRGMTYKCDVCPKRFPSSLQLEKHVELHHCVSDNTLKCKFCKLQLPTQEDFKKHVLEQHPTAANAKNVHVCKVCNQRFPLASHLDQHIRVVHEEPESGSDSQGSKTGNDMYKCPICQKEVKQLQYLMMHLRSKHKDIM